MPRHSPARGSTRTSYGTKTVYSRTILRPARELYRRLRDIRQLLALVKETPRKISEDGGQFEILCADGESRITGEILNEKAGSVIAWQSLPDSDFVHAGTIRFDRAPGDEGTEVTVTLEYAGGGGSAKLSKQALSGPGKVVGETLRRFKALVEAGEIPTIQGQPVGEPQKSKQKK